MHSMLPTNMQIDMNAATHNERPRVCRSLLEMGGLECDRQRVLNNRKFVETWGSVLSRGTDAVKQVSRTKRAQMSP
jgi:hypothetical protein